ncbi:MAG: Smr/MutS family protein [Clostridia bacterium]|nr:Smr/MutS family protein [Clostridia bacterium]
MIRVINIKEGNPNCDYALFLVDEEIKYSRAVGNRAVVIIHGYGSHGKGGLIKDAVHNYLPTLKKKHIISDYVFGEQWGDTNESKINMCRICPELILQENLQTLNSGVSVILI